MILWLKSVRLRFCKAYKRLATSAVNLPATASYITMLTSTDGATRYLHLCFVLFCFNGKLALNVRMVMLALHSTCL